MASNFYELLCLCQLTFPDLHGLGRAAQVIDRNTSEPYVCSKTRCPSCAEYLAEPVQIFLNGQEIEPLALFNFTEV